MNSEEFKSLKVGSRVIESVYNPNGACREQIEYEVTTRYDSSTVGIMEILNATSIPRSKRKKRNGKLLHDIPTEIVFFKLA